MREILVVDDPAAEAAEHIAKVAGVGGHIALAGGSSPERAYELTAAKPVDWSRAKVWFSDDRAVPPDHELSNYGMAKRALLDRIEGDGPEVHRVKGELGFEAAADDYERELRQDFPDVEGFPRLDLILLGLGPDAHCASLYPEAPELEVKDRLCVGVPEAGMEPYVPRVTFTLALINAGIDVVFVVEDGKKAEAVERAFGRGPSPKAPASLVDPSGGTLTVLLSRAAADRLETGDS